MPIHGFSAELRMTANKKNNKYKKSTFVGAAKFFYSFNGVREINFLILKLRVLALSKIVCIDIG